MRLSECHNAKIIIHPINKQKQCSSCGRICKERINILDSAIILEKPIESEYVSEVKEKKPRTYTESQKWHINKWAEKKKAEEYLAKKKYFNSIKHTIKDD